jgi:two-component system OmpR family response regulator
MSRRILVVEDDTSTADFVAKGLREEGYTVEHVADGRDGLYMASSSEFDAVVMDRSLPGMDGLSVIKALRAAAVETPILILSALGQLDDRVRGLRSGGDDYLTKPFGFSELHARLELLMTRRNGRTVDVELTCGDLRMNLLTREVSRGPRRIDLLPREFKLLEYLLRNKGRVATRVMLLERVWDYRFDPQTSLIDTHMSRLRRKIEAPGEPPLLHTIRGAGFRLAERP